jgi:hypothetical protein
MKDSEISALVDEAGRLDVEIKERSKRLAEIKAALVAEAEARPEAHDSGVKGGRHWIFDGDSHQVTVTYPDPGIALRDDAVNAVKETAGICFGQLFEREVSYKPVKAFRVLLENLLTKVKAKKVLKLCEVQASPRVGFKAR